MPVIFLGIALILLVVYGFNREMLDRHRKNAKGICNHDPQYREFIYRTDLSVRVVRDRLLHEFRVPHTKYRFDLEGNRITFYSDIPNGSQPVSFVVYLNERENDTTIRVVQADHLYANKLYPLMQNEYWEALAQAEPIPYSND